MVDWFLHVRETYLSNVFGCIHLSFIMFSCTEQLYNLNTLVSLSISNQNIRISNKNVQPSIYWAYNFFLSKNPNIDFEISPLFYCEIINPREKSNSQCNYLFDHRSFYYIWCMVTDNIYRILYWYCWRIIGACECEATQHWLRLCFS